MSARNRMILVGAAAFLVVLLAFFLLIRPRQGELEDVRALVEQEEGLEQQLTLDLQRLQELQRQEPQLRADLERIRQLVPADHEVHNLLFQVNNAANQAGVDFVQITPELPKSPPEGAALAEVRVSIGGSGGYFAIQDFIRRLYALDRALRIDLLDLSSQEGSEISLTATARVFFEQPTGFVPGTTPVAPPPVAPAPAPAASPTAPEPSPTAATTP
ncbi:MAG TPA: type 4a pilus biogenesis protein PilO [Actinomycetota bacterium]|nr:type 4a pilus biogenesis protein PilO [Actinomycetota bacterium]